MHDNAISELDQTLRGRLIRQCDPDYDAARALYNGMIDKRPLMIAQCVDAADVVAAVNFAREKGLRVAVRGGGHNGPGLGSVDDGLLIDLGRMRWRPRRSGERAPFASGPAAHPATSTTPPTPTGSRCRSASSRPPASPASRSAAAWGTSAASTG